MDIDQTPAGRYSVLTPGTFYDFDLPNGLRKQQALFHGFDGTTLSISIGGKLTTMADSPLIHVYDQFGNKGF